MSENNVNTGNPSWLWILFRGIIGIIFGLCALFMTGATSVAVLQVIAIFILIDSILLIVHLIKGKEVIIPKWLLWIRAILGVWLGIYVVFLHPAAGTVLFGLSLVMVIAIQAIMIGIFEIIAAFSVKDMGFWAFILGAIWILFGIALIIAPMQSILVLVLVNGMFALILGIALVFYSFKYRKLYN